MKTKLTFLAIALSFVMFAKGQPGSYDPSFNIGTGADNIIFCTVIQSDGKIVIGGAFSTYNGIARKNIARLNADGSLDTSFDPGLGASASVRAMAIQSDGKIIIAGGFVTYNGISVNRLARINTDGSFDASFDPGWGPGSTVTAVAIQNDGKIIIGGMFTTYNFITRNMIARINTNGSLDTSFDPGTGTNIYISSLAIQNDGKIIIGGDFTTYTGISRVRIARINTNGSLDTSFDPGLGASAIINTISIQSDGKIFIGGNFFLYNGTGRSCIARINPNGSLDTSFDPGIGSNHYVYGSAIQSDGKIIAVGAFTSYNGSSRFRVVRINEDGSIDASFNSGAGANNMVRAVAIQSYGRVIVVGDFTTFNSIGKNYIARLRNCYGSSSSQDITTCNSYTSPSGEYTWTVSGSYLDTIPNIAGCDSVITINLTIKTVDISVSISDNTFYANATNATYKWLDCDSNFDAIEGETNQSFTPLVYGYYAVMITKDDCVDTSSCYYSTIITEVEDISSDKVYLYPNPNNGTFFIETTLKNNLPYAILDITGRKVLDGLLKEGQTTIDMLSSEKGLYFLKANKHTLKLIKQ